MFTLTSIVTRGILAAATIGGLAVVADGAVRAQLERAVRSSTSVAEPSSARTIPPEPRLAATDRGRARRDATAMATAPGDAR